MLFAHLVPGYFAAERSQPYWNPKWSQPKRAALWTAALGSTAAPDLDVMYNAVFRGFFGHSILWTHSLFPYLGLLVIWWLMRKTGQSVYLRTMLGLVIVGGFSHILLDMIAHGTPVFYPLSVKLFGSSSVRVLERGLLPYLTDPVFLLEPPLLILAAVHWTARRYREKPRLKTAALMGLFSAWGAFSIAYLWLLPRLHSM